MLIEKNDISKEELLLYKDILPKNLPKIKIVSIGGVDKKHDKTFKNILSDIKEMSKFLSQYLNLEVNEEDLEKYKNSFITSTYKSKESYMIYKQKDKEIYYLIEHQSTVDKEMPNRILGYSEALIEEIHRGNSLKKEENPIIVPIVIYTGFQEWTVKTNFSNTQKGEAKYKKYLISFEYELIDISKYNKEELIEKDTKLSSMMLIEKFETSEDIKNILIDLINKAKDQERIKWIKDIVTYILSNVLEKEDISDVLKIIEKKENNSMDDEWIERVKRNNAKIKNDLINQGKEEGKKEGIKETIKAMIKSMLSYNETDEKIINYTKVSKKELEKIKKEVQIQN